jgi:intracellular multiplication protein IcmD
MKLNVKSKLNAKSIAKAAVYATVAAGFFAVAAYADTTAPTNSLGDVAGTLTLSYANLASTITALSYIAGFCFTIASIFKFKQHKDNPQQVPVTTGIALLALGTGLIFMPSIFQMGGATLFTDAQVSGVGGTTTFDGAKIPTGS